MEGVYPVQSKGERMVFEVQSDRTPGKKYRVDLLANQGGGWCACRDHAVRRQPFLDRAGHPFDPRGACKHTKKARDYVLWQLLQKMARMEELEG